jgi:WhiB family redox-sensing transcriptional regulator
MSQMSRQLNAYTSSSGNSHELARSANCKGVNPKVFDFTEWERARYALVLCSSCPVKDLCVAEIDPVWNSYDGVCGGFVWLNGKPLIRQYLVLTEAERPYANMDGIEKYLRKRNRGGLYDFVG